MRFILTWCWWCSCCLLLQHTALDWCTHVALALMWAAAGPKEWARTHTDTHTHQNPINPQPSCWTTSTLSSFRILISFMSGFVFALQTFLILTASLSTHLCSSRFSRVPDLLGKRRLLCAEVADWDLSWGWQGSLSLSQHAQRACTVAANTHPRGGRRVCSSSRLYSLLTSRQGRLTPLPHDAAANLLVSYPWLNRSPPC